MTIIAHVPGSRSITNRALVCAALADGTSVLDGVLDADDTEAMLDCLAALGITVRVEGDVAEVDGCGGAPASGPRSLQTRLSGTTTRFVVPLCALGSGSYTVDASGAMRRRPMGDLLTTLGQLGVILRDTQGHLPLTVEASGGLDGGTVSIRGDSSSQFVSGLLLAAPAMRHGLDLRVDGELKSRPFVEMTRSVMRSFGAHVVDGRVDPGGYRPTRYRIEPDALSACYFWAAAAITGATVRVDGIGASSIQGDVAFVDVLERMGCTVDKGPSYISVTGPTRLRAVEVDLSDISDQAPTLAVVAAFAQGTTRAGGIGFIRHKESDRIAAVVTELSRLGVPAAEEPDGFLVHGRRPRPGSVETYDDHRIAMSFALAGLVVPGIEILDPEVVGKTFPGYFGELARFRSEWRGRRA